MGRDVDGRYYCQSSLEKHKLSFLIQITRRRDLQPFTSSVSFIFTFNYIPIKHKQILHGVLLYLEVKASKNIGFVNVLRSNYAVAKSPGLARSTRVL